MTSSPPPYRPHAYGSQQYPPPVPPPSMAAQQPMPNAPAGAGRARPHPGRRRSVAWVYYTILAVLGPIFTISQGHPSGLVVTALCGAYATYLFRGGRFVIWIW